MEAADETRNETPRPDDENLPLAWQLATDLAESGRLTEAHTMLQFGLLDAERTLVPGVAEMWREACRAFAAHYGLPDEQRRDGNI